MQANNLLILTCSFPLGYCLLFPRTKPHSSWSLGRIPWHFQPWVNRSWILQEWHSWMSLPPMPGLSCRPLLARDAASRRRWRNQCQMHDILLPRDQKQTRKSRGAWLPRCRQQLPSSLGLLSSTNTRVHAVLMATHCQLLLMHVSLLSQGWRHSWQCKAELSWTAPYVLPTYCHRTPAGSAQTQGLER